MTDLDISYMCLSNSEGSGEGLMVSTVQWSSVYKRKNA